MINEKSPVNKKSTIKSPESLSEDLRRCLRERALFHRQFYYRLSNDPETRLKIEKLSNQSSKFLQQNHLQNDIKSNLVIQSDDQIYKEKSSNSNISDPLHESDNKFVDKECTKLFTNINKGETHKPLIIQSYKFSKINNTNTNKSLPIQLNEISSEHVFKTCFNSIPTNATPITTNTLKMNTNDVNELSITTDSNHQQQQQQQQLVMLPQLPNTLTNINKNQNDITEINATKVLNSHDHNNKNELINNIVKDDIIVIKKEPMNTILSEDLKSSINDIGKKNSIHTTDITTTFNPSDNNIKYIPVVDKTNCNCDSVLDYFSRVTDGDRETCNNSDYSTILPATTIDCHYQNNNKNSEFKCLNLLKREILSSSSSVLDTTKSLLPSQKLEINNNTHSLSSSDLLSSTSVLSQCLSFDKLSNCYSNSYSSSSSGSSSYCCCTNNKHINKFENTINSTDQYNNYSEQVDSSDGIQVIPIKFSSSNRILNDNNNDNDDGFLIKKRKRDLYRKFLKDQQKLESKNKLLIRRKYEENQNQEEYQFPCVEKLIKMYTKLLQDKKTEGQLQKPENKNDDSNEKLSRSCETDEKKLSADDKSTEFQHQGSPVSDEGCLLGLSPYSSDCEDTETDGTRRVKEKVARSSSSDSALGLDEEVSNIKLTDQPDPPNSVQHKKGRRQTLTVADIPLRTALLPVAEPTQLPDSPTLQDAPNHLNALITQTAIPSKVLLEERVVEIPEDRFGSLSSSRRESAQSCMSDYNSSEFGGVRFVRTPSVVVSDYSDDVMCGITLEEIEYFRAQRMRRRSSADTATTEKDDACSEVSGSSSCSNLYYCGSTISALDGTECYVNGIRRKIDRKISDCSMCSTVSGDDDDDNNNDFRKHDEFQDQLNMELNSQQQQQNLDKQLSRKKVGNSNKKES